jgi:hypothetical protein
VDRAGWSNAAADSSVSAVSAVTSSSVSLWARAAAARLDYLSGTEIA